MSRRLVGWLKRRFRPIDPPQEPRRSPDGDLSNGFGARRLLCSPLVPGGDPGPLPRASVLEGMTLRLHRLPVKQDPRAALQGLPVALFAEQAAFTLMLNADE